MNPFTLEWLAGWQAKQAAALRDPARLEHASRDGVTAGQQARAAATAAVNGVSSGVLPRAADEREPRQPHGSDPARVLAAIRRLTTETRKHERPEEELQSAIVDALLPRLLPGVRMMSCNGELPGGKEMEGRAARRKRMGYMRGMPDLMARGRDLLWLECKVGQNKQTKEQADFARWAIESGDGYAVVRSVDDALAALREWGMVR